MSGDVSLRMLSPFVHNSVRFYLPSVYISVTLHVADVFRYWFAVRRHQVFAAVSV